MVERGPHTGGVKGRIHDMNMLEDITVSKVTVRENVKITDEVVGQELTKFVRDFETTENI